VDPPAELPLRVAVVGAGGRMGSFACRLLADRPDFELVARIVRGDDLAARLAATRPTVGLDLTVAGQGARHGHALLLAGVRPVIGTSGVTPDELRALDADARERGSGGLVVANFSRGAWLVQRLCAEAARHLAAAEIVEAHHATKRDAPSATALETARTIARARGLGEGAEAAVPIHSVRLPGLRANQEVLFGGAGEIVAIRHETYGPEAYAAGLVAALHHAARASGVASGLGPAFGG